MADVYKRQVGNDVVGGKQAEHRVGIALKQKECG